MRNKKDPFDFEKEVLGNGTEIFYQKTRRKETELRLLLKAGGARYDPRGREGCAHMLDHLIPKKTINFPDEIAIRNYDLEHDLKWNVRVNLENIWFPGGSDKKKSDRLFFLLEEFLTRHQLDEKLLEEEKTVVIQEMSVEQKIENWVRVFLDTKRILFGKHPFGRIINPRGTLESVSSLTIDDLKEHREKFFWASNLTVVIITSLSLKEVKSKVERYFVLPTDKSFHYPEPLRDFPKPAKNLCLYSVSEITRADRERLREIGDRVELFAVVPSLEATSSWEIIIKTLREIFLRKLRYTKTPLVYDLSVSGNRWRDIALLNFWTIVPSGKGFEVKDLLFEGISQFQHQKRFFGLFKKSRLRELKNYPTCLLSKIAKEAMEDIAIYDRPRLIREEIEEIESFSFREAVEQVDHWLNEERILVRIITP